MCVYVFCLLHGVYGLILLSPPLFFILFFFFIKLMTYYFFILFVKLLDGVFSSTLRWFYLAETDVVYSFNTDVSNSFVWRSTC